MSYYLNKKSFCYLLKGHLERIFLIFFLKSLDSSAFLFIFAVKY